MSPKERGEGKPSRSSGPSSSRRGSARRLPSAARAEGDEAEAPPSSGQARRRRRRRARRARPLPIALAAVGVLLAAISIGFFLVLPSRPGPSTGRVVELEIARGEGPASVADKLAQAGLVARPGLASLYLRMTRLDAAPGSHVLTDDASLGELARRLERRGAARTRVTFPEGFTRFDMAKRLASKHVCTERAFLEASADRELMRELAIEAPTAEGYLFASTYDLALDADARDVVRRLKGELDKRLTIIEQAHPLGRAELERSLGWGRHEILTLASIVEKEAVVDDERPIIASVFLNRLRDPGFKRRLLQSDPTSGYACLAMPERVPSCAGYHGKITPALNRDPSNPYSTYVHAGLPPGPIGNPSAKSIRAVLAPASTRYLYFVARGGGRHAFSERLEEHDTAIKDMRDRRAVEP